jgi:hypothetical protein
MTRQKGDTETYIMTGEDKGEEDSQEGSDQGASEVGGGKTGMANPKRKILGRLL